MLIRPSFITDPRAMSSLASRLHTLLIEEKFADCCFNVKSTHIYAHRIILASASPVFEAMFFGPFATQQREGLNAAIAQGQQHKPPRDCAGNETVIVDVSEKVFRAVLYYVYTDEIDWDALTDYELLELHYCAEKYLLRDLVSRTCDRINTTLNCNNLFLAYDFALRFGINSLLNDCRRMVQELLERKPNLFVKKVLHLDRVVAEIDGENSSSDEDHRPAVKRKPPVPIEFIEDLVFSSSCTTDDQGDSPGGWQYHHVSRECINDLLLLNFNDADGTFNENLLMFVLKWTNIERRMMHAKGEERLPLQKLGLLNFFEPFVCHKRILPLVENLIKYLETQSVLRAPHLGWHLLQRVGLKASRPLTISGESLCFVTHFQVNHLLTIKSFIINSRLNNVVTSRVLRFNRQFLYKENLMMEILVSDPTEDRPIHRQQFNLESEFNSQCELFLNKCLFFHPDKIYALRLIWPQDSLIREYPLKIFERCHNLALKDQPLSVIFMDDVNSRWTNKDSELTAGGILQGMHFMFVRR